MAEPKIESISELKDYFYRTSDTTVYYVEIYQIEKITDKLEELCDCSNFFGKPFTYFKGNWENKISSLLEKYDDNNIRRNIEVKSLLVNNAFSIGAEDPCWFTFAKGLWNTIEDLKSNQDLFKVFSLNDILNELKVNKPDVEWFYSSNVLYYNEMEVQDLIELEHDGKITDVWDRDEVDVDDLERWDEEAQKRADEDPSDDPRLGKIP